MKVVVLLCTLLLLPSLAAAEELLIATTAYCPLVCPDENSAGEGVMHDVLRTAFKGTGYTIAFRYIPYGRAIEDTLNGEYAAVTFAGTANSPDFLFVRNFVMVNTVQFAVKAHTKWDYRGIESLKNVRVGIPRGFVTGNQDIDDYFSSPENARHIIFASSSNPTRAQEQNLRRLMENRLDAMLVGSLAFRFIADKMGVASEVRLDSTIVAQFRNHLAFSPKLPNTLDLRNFVEKRIHAMQTNGELDAILEAYGLPR